MKPAPKILLVDDDAEITSLLSDYLVRFGYRTCTANDGVGMRRQLGEQAVDLIVLDLMLPGVDGLALAREVRSTSRLPIIMLTARSTPYDRVLGLEMGADDYMGKPFEPRELVARIQTVLRRSRAHMDAGTSTAEADVVHFDGWALRRNERHLVTPAGMVVPLSNAEYRLLSTFLSMPRRLFSREQLMQQARGRSFDAFERSMDLLVSRLRQKLNEDPALPSIIKTVRGAGYMLDVRSVQAQVAWTA